MRYQRGDIMELVEMVGSDNILKVYKGVIGLYTLHASLINRDNENDILRSDLVKKLNALVTSNENPFLQLLSLQILSSIVHQTSR